MAISPAAACSLFSVNYCCGHWTTCVVIELLCGHWTDWIFWTMYTEHKKQKIVKAELNLWACFPIIFFI